ncbi:JAB domain-containing protein [Paenibacillus massiliensis]|uniref:JAB domain-containing protein n=1 Tax=Paenibacillus massiliensis TaxID=225917 RepID=UPI00036E8518|nr:JAB domain-containing protein [Paenibacillus massiliensis]
MATPPLDELMIADYVKSLHKLTGIPLRKLQQYGAHNNLLNAVEHPYALELTTKQLHKVEQLNAFLRSHRVLQWEEENAKQKISSPESAHRYFSAFLSGVKDREQFMAAFLDIKNQVIETRIISEGGVSEALVHPRSVLKAALNCDCSSIILAHNHPSGIPTPSHEDMILTQRMVTIFDPLHINVLDHIIIGGTNFASLAELGQMPRVAEKAPSYEVITATARERSIKYAFEELGHEIGDELSDDEWER